MKAIYLKAEREKKGLTQEQLEDASGVSQGTISRLERDADADASFSTVVRLAETLGVDPRALKFGPTPDGAAAR